MKFVKFTVVALFAALLAVGCADEKLSFNTENGNTFGDGNSSEGGENTPSNVGYLSLSDLVVDCRIVDNDPDTGVDPSVSTYSTRTSVDVNNFDCSIINDEGVVVMAFKYAERPTEPIMLETGDYIFKIQSGEVEGAVWESPVYGATRAFKIVRKQSTPLSEVVCTLMQIKVTIIYAVDLMERLRDTNTTVTVGENSLVYSLDEKRAGYFYATSQANNTIELLIDGQYAADKENFKPVKMTKQITGVKAGQHSKIHLYIEHAEEGNIKVSATISDWVIDEVIPCNVADFVTEEEWKEDEGKEEPTPTEAPDIIWEGYDFSKRYPITSDLTVDLVVVASSGIKELLCEIDSETLTPEQLSSVNLCNILNLCYPKQSYDSNNPTDYIDVEQPLRDLDFAVAEEVLNQKSVNLSITKFLMVLQGVSGSSLKYHNFVLTVTDNNNVTTVRTLQLQTGK